MGTKEKLIERFKQLPKDFTFDEVKRLMASFGYCVYNKGKTSCSRVRFVDANGNYLHIHKPHPANVMKEGALKSIMNHLTKYNNLK